MTDTPASPRPAMIRAFQWDLARQVERLDWLLAQLPRYAEWGYQELYLHLEDAVEYPSLPGVARRDAYTYRQLERLVAAAARAGIKVVPIVNLLGHTQYLIKVPELRDLNELRAPDGSPLDRGQICPLHPRTLEIADKLLRDMAPFCTAGKVHVGLDESFQLGRHPLSRREIARIGLPAHFARYVGRLRQVAKSLGLRMGMWADMLYFLEAAIPLLPTDIAAYEWYYYPFQRRPRVEMFNFAESDVGEKLRARGIEYWGCPMNGAFRFEPLPHFTDRLENILSWWTRCHRLGAAGMLVTSWEPYRLAMELTTVVDAAAASVWLDGLTEPRAMLERGFARVFGRRQGKTSGAGRTVRPQARKAPATATYAQTYSAAERRAARAAAELALAGDAYPFSGYPRWEINGRWDVVSRREPLEAFRAEERHFAALRRRAAGIRIAAPLRASIDLRWCLAVRDVWVREAARGSRPFVSELERTLRIGLAAARAMWTATRAPRGTSPNETILNADLDRLRRAARGEPVFGPRWQLCYRVRNVAPAVQLVGVEERQPDGRWEMRQACHTIEFQALGARPRHGLTREHAAPVTWDGELAHPPLLRLVLRGVGRVIIEDIVLTDGVNTVRPTGPRRRELGRAAPTRGFPVIDWQVNQAESPVRFAVKPAGERR